ncbi:MAG TPA: hypothetical protein PKI27_00680 [Dermatophilaceae bacterium]|jgi:hypothetical protein|nr:hypothetical protein [Dermatophilaceae bacterium]
MAGAGFIRRFTFDPGMEELLAIEGVVIIDREPPAQLTGVGTGMVTLIAEFEDGPFETPYQVASSADFLAAFGGFGFVYDGTPSNNPCARTRKADGAITPEYWNGNGFIGLTKKRFRQLNVVRVDTSVGAVEFRRLAWLLGASDFSFDLEPGQFITTDVGGGPLVATFNATAAVLTGGAFVGALADGDTITIGYDAETDFTVTFLATDVTITDAISRINQTAGFTFASNFGGAIQFTGRVRGTDGEVRIVSEAPAGVLAKLGLSLSGTKGSETSNAASFPVALVPGDTFIGKVDNQAIADTLTIEATPASITGAAATYAAVLPGDILVVQINGIPGNQTIIFTGLEATQAAFLNTINGQLTGGAALDNGGQVEIRTDRKGSSAGGAIVAGTPAVLVSLGLAPAALVNPGPNNVADVYAVTAAEFAGLLTTTFVNGTAGSTGVNLGGTRVRWETNTPGPAPNGVQFTGGTGVAAIPGFDLLVHNGTTGAPTVVNGTGNVGNIDAVSSAEVDAVINAANPAVNVTRDSATNKLLMANTATPLTGTLDVTATTATALGFTAGQSADAAVGVDGVIPAGTRVRDGVGTEWVTAQTTAVTADNPGPYSIKVRPATDDTLTAGAGAGSVTVLPFPIQTVGAFAVINPFALAAALTESQLDAKYMAALDTTKNLSSIVRQTNIIASARQSNAIRTALRTNVIEASSEGCFGRMAVIRPPLKTTRAAAKSIAAQPGVGAYRHSRVVYCYPGAHIYVPQIAAVGTAGGPGFTADGQIDVGFDLWVASVLSQLPPEENPGQATDFMSEILSVETGNADVQNLAIGDYRAFKAAGIASLRMEQGVAIIQSGVTSVDPLVNPNLKNINRQRMADFITDTLSLRLNAFSKQLATRVRRALIVGEIDSFMSTLRGDANPANQRIEGYLIDAISGNTPETLAAGLFRIILRVRTLPSMDIIVLDTQVGETVNISQAA